MRRCGLHGANKNKKCTANAKRYEIDFPKTIGVRRLFSQGVPIYFKIIQFLIPFKKTYNRIFFKNA